MAANPDGLPTPPGPDEHPHDLCPVCSWRPCTRRCRLGLTAADLEEFERMFGPKPGETANEGGDRP